jgi:hypothetical protein
MVPKPFGTVANPTFIYGWEGMPDRLPRQSAATEFLHNHSEDGVLQFLAADRLGDFGCSSAHSLHSHLSARNVRHYLGNTPSRVGPRSEW